ncbi:AmiS/UreI family transporter [Kocuria rosea]|nr:AmiS/UreI family transporter [Kocuria rosea]
MSAVGLLYVGAVLFVNGMMLLDHVSDPGAAPL